MVPVQTSQAIHTPNPWHFPGVQKKDGVYCSSVHADDFTIVATVVGDQSTVTANARLIAACPDLLELAKQIVLEAEDEDNCRIPDDIVKEAERLVAKAESL